jgi:hypothetical protein
VPDQPSQLCARPAAIEPLDQPHARAPLRHAPRQDGAARSRSVTGSPARSGGRPQHRQAHRSALLHHAEHRGGPPPNPRIGCDAATSLAMPDQGAEREIAPRGCRLGWGVARACRAYTAPSRRPARSRSSAACSTPPGSTARASWWTSARAWAGAPAQPRSGPSAACSYRAARPLRAAIHTQHHHLVDPSPRDRPAPPPPADPAPLLPPPPSAGR